MKKIFLGKPVVLAPVVLAAGLELEMRGLHGDRAACCAKLPSNSIEAAVFHLFASAGCNSTFASVPLIAGVTRGHVRC